MLIFSLSILIIHGKILLDIILFSCTQFFFLEGAVYFLLL